MSPSELIECVKRAQERAEKHDSGIDAGVLGIRGFSTGVMRRFFNNLLFEVVGKKNAQVQYLEVGAYFGGTACAAVNNNPEVDALFFEDFSQPFGAENVMHGLYSNIAEFCGDRAALSTVDFFSAEADLVLATFDPFDVYFYDGEHSYDHQRKALSRAAPFLANSFIFMVDDFNWNHVKRGTMDSLLDVPNLTVHWQKHIEGEKLADDPIWWNGLGIFVCSK